MFTYLLVYVHNTKPGSFHQLFPLDLKHQDIGDHPNGFQTNVQIMDQAISESHKSLRIYCGRHMAWPEMKQKGRLTVNSAKFTDFHIFHRGIRLDAAAGPHWTAEMELAKMGDVTHPPCSGLSQSKCKISWSALVSHGFTLLQSVAHISHANRHQLGSEKKALPW